MFKVTFCRPRNWDEVAFLWLNKEMKGTRPLFFQCSTLSCFPCSSYWGNLLPEVFFHMVMCNEQMPGGWSHLGATKELTSPWLCWVVDAFSSQHHLLDSQEKQFCFFCSSLCYEEIYTELQMLKGQIQRGGPFPWLDSLSTPSIICQQIVGKGTWRGLRDNDTFPGKHTAQWLSGDWGLQRQVGTS